MTNKEIVSKWEHGIPARAGSISTDGLKLYSYALEIGFTGEDGKLYVHNYTAHNDTDWKGCPVAGSFVSSTTSTHVGLARRVAYPVKVPS